MAVIVDYCGKTALVTGGSRGIGLAIVRQMAKAGADIALTYGSTPKNEINALLQTLRTDYPGVVFEAFQLDGTSSASYSALIRDVASSTKFKGSLDIVIANAGVSLHIDAEDMTDEQLMHVFNVNTFGPYFEECVKLWLDGKPKSKGCLDGKVAITISSISAQVAMDPQKQAAYNASKAAVTAFTKSLAGEWATLGFRLSAISPGYVYSDMIANVDKSWVEKWNGRTAMGRMASTEEIARSVAMLCSDEFTFMTGSDLIVDGGYTIY